MQTSPQVLMRVLRLSLMIRTIFLHSHSLLPFHSVSILAAVDSLPGRVTQSFIPEESEPLEILPVAFHHPLPADVNIVGAAPEDSLRFRNVLRAPIYRGDSVSPSFSVTGPLILLVFYFIGIRTQYV